jgi:two-component system, OmpR family, sensor histidine kinase VicK
MGSKPALTTRQPFLAGGGEMGRLTREYDWSVSELGEPDTWPQSLRTTLSIILHNKFPMFLWWGPNLLCFYNDAYRPSLGNNGKHPSILGMPAREAWPEIWDYISPLINQVLSGSEAIYNEDLLLPIFRNGEMEEVYWTFSYSPVPNDAGAIAGVLVTCSETTHKVRMLQHLQESERRFESLINDATVGVIVLDGEDMVIQVVNGAYGNLIDRTVPELLGRPLFDIIPEVASEFRPMLTNVLQTGEPVYLYEHPYRVFKNSKEINGFLNVVYQPYRETGGDITGVMALCQDVTEQVAAKLNIKTALEQVRLSKEAAQLGTFDMDLEKGTLDWDRRCRTLFGISHNDPVTYERDFVNGLHPDDKDGITTLISALFSNPGGNGEYDVEYRTIGVDDGRTRWVRAKGKVYFDAQDRPLRFIGSVLDITDQKINEQRKNDFIAMVSHELKTPLTSLTAYIQLLLRETREKGESLEADILGRANVQTRKMTGLINGFLNLSRLELGKLELQMKRFLIDDLIREVIDDLSVGIIQTEFEFLPCSPTEVAADREKIGAVIANFLSNAIKYSPKGKQILITCALRHGEVTVSVADRGMGIKADDVPHVFDRFYRVDNDNTKDISGFGIGLYLSAEIIRIHGGRIWVESDYGLGSTFYFTIPSKAPIHPPL